MKHLIPGTLNAERLVLLISLTSIRSEDIIEGLNWHLCRGHQLATAAALAQVPQNNLSRALDKVEAVADIVEQIKQHDRFSRFVDSGPDDVVVTDSED
jgi:hypothetical protein